MPHTEGAQSSQSFIRAKRVPIAESYGSLVLWSKYLFVRSPLCSLWLLCVRSISMRSLFAFFAYPLREVNFRASINFRVSITVEDAFDTMC